MIQDEWRNLIVLVSENAGQLVSWDVNSESITLHECSLGALWASSRQSSEHTRVRFTIK